MPDLSSTDDYATGTLVPPSYIVSVAHNTKFTSSKFGNGAKYAYSYKFIARNDDPGYPADTPQDFQSPRLNKVVTDAGNFLYWLNVERS